jgi:hypothetical protein
LDGWIFASKESLVDCVWARGVKQVSGGRHRRADMVAERFRTVMKKLIA